MAGTVKGLSDEGPTHGFHEARLRLCGHHWHCQVLGPAGQASLQPAMSFFSRVAQSAGLASRPVETAAPAPAGSSAAAAGPGTPLHLIQYNAETKQFELGQEALAVLRGVTGPVGVVSVCGRARQVGSDHSCC